MTCRSADVPPVRVTTYVTQGRSSVMTYLSGIYLNCLDVRERVQESER